MKKNSKSSILMEGSVVLNRIISEKVLTIGPDHHNHRGGIGAVIEIYSKYFEVFKFLPSFKVGSTFFKCVIFVYCILQLFARLTFDRKIKIVHIHGASHGSFFRKFICFLIVKYFFRKKVIYHIHGGGFAGFYKSTPSINKLAIKFFIEHSDRVICLSQSWENFYKDNFKQESISVIPNIIDYPSVAIKKRDENFITYLFLGKMCPAKGIFDLLEVISKNRSKYQGKMKLIIGGNGDVDRVNKLIKELDGLVEFVGWVTHNEKINWLQKADVYILPSYMEGLPISILEAMSYDQAIISSNVGGIPEIVIPGKNGILIEPGNFSEIESALNFFIKHPEKLDIYGRESQRMIKKYLPNSVMRELSDAYISLIN